MDNSTHQSVMKGEQSGAMPEVLCKAEVVIIPALGSRSGLTASRCFQQISKDKDELQLLTPQSSSPPLHPHLFLVILH